MKTTQEQVLITRNEQGEPISVVVFEGKSHTFFTLDKMGMEDITKVLNRKMDEEKI